MSHELLYTSAPRGLRPGTNGYCPVAATRGLPGGLGQQLERLSDYRPLFDPAGPGANRNPVALSHLRVSGSGKTYSVLSRICPAGVDHTQRGIFFAHHVALEPAELPPAGPAWLLAQPGFLAKRWDGQVRELPAGRQPPAGTGPAGVCRAWKQATGDAGWAGVLAESFLDHPERPVYLLYPLGLDLLPLLAEALALLPPDQRWRVTFSTFYVSVPPDVGCAWRCLPAEAPAASRARATPGALVLDLASLPGKAAHGGGRGCGPGRAFGQGPPGGGGGGRRPVGRGPGGRAGRGRAGRGRAGGPPPCSNRRGRRAARGWRPPHLPCRPPSRWPFRNLRR